MLKNFQIQKRARKSPATNSLSQEESRLLELLGQEDFLPEKLDAKPLRKKFPTPQKDTGVIIRQRTPLPVPEEVEEELLHDTTEQLIALGEEINSIIFPDEPADFNAPLIDAIANARHTPVSGRNRLIEQIEEDAWEIKPTDNFSAEAKATLAALGVEVEWREPLHDITEPEPEPEEEESGGDDCPCGFRFGTDCDKHDECDECEEYGPCRHKLGDVVDKENPALPEEQDNPDITTTQLYTVFNQMYGALHPDKKPGHPNGWWAELHNESEGFGHPDLEQIRELAESWMEVRKDPQDLIRKYPRAEITLRFLRKYVTGWKEYEEEYKDLSLKKRIASVIAAGWSSKPTEDSFDDILDELTYPHEFNPDREKYFKQYRSFLKQELEDLDKIHPKKPPFPKKWMESTVALRGVWETKKGERFIKLLNLLWEMKMSHPKSQEMIENHDLQPDLKNKGRSMVEAHRALTRVETFKRIGKNVVLVEADRKIIADKLGVSPMTVLHDLERAEKAGALIKLRKAGPNAHYVYAIAKKGHHTFKKNGEPGGRPIHSLLNDTPANRRRLVQVFAPPSKRKKKLPKHTTPASK